MINLTAGDLMRIAGHVIQQPHVRDAGLMEAAAARPQATFDGQPVYGDLVEMAAALTESLVTNHALVDGNKRLGLAGLLVFLGINGHTVTMSNGEAYDFIYGIASGQLRGVPEIARQLRPYVLSKQS
ncbi:MAG: type II toxin-antitoxin system death-on-curing family toxin [Candidatus Nanopelagicales bacterium]